MRAFAWLGVVVALAGCKGKAVDDRPLDDTKVVVGPQDATINGHRVASRGDVDPGAMKRIDPVFAWAKGMREHWKTIHPGQDFVSRADVTFPADLTLAAGASLLGSLAFAGYPVGVTIHCGDGSMVFDYSVSGPPPPTADGGIAAPEATLQLCAPPAWQARSVRQGPADPPGALGDAVGFGLIAACRSPASSSASCARSRASCFRRRRGGRSR